MSIPARKYHTRQVHFLDAVVTFNTPGIADGVQIGTLPAGAQILHTIVNVTQAFNAATTNDLTVGTTPTGNDIAAAATVAANTAGAKESTAGRSLDIQADLPVYARYVQAGAAATAGRARVVIEYAVDIAP